MLTLLATVAAPARYAAVSGMDCLRHDAIDVRPWRCVAAVLLASALGGFHVNSLTLAAEVAGSDAAVAEAAAAAPAEPAEAMTAPPTTAAEAERPAAAESTGAAEITASAETTAAGETVAPGASEAKADSATEAVDSPSSLRDVEAAASAEPTVPPVDSSTALEVEAAAERRLLSEPLVSTTHIHYLAKNRPAWLDSKPVVEGDVHRVAVKAGPHYRMRQCLIDLDEELGNATSEFINEQLGSDRAAILVSFRLDEIKNRLVRETFEQQLETSVGVMNQAHALLVFDRPFVRELNDRWHRIKALVRLLQVGLGAAVVLLLLSTVFAYFRLDTATKGYYTGRLQIMAAVAILALAAVGVLMAQWIPWM